MAPDDLRAKIVHTTVELLETAPSVHAVTVAAVLRGAGCTPPSLYHYWPSRDALLREASQVGWREFHASQVGAGDEAGTPITQIRARGRAYVEFALARRALFRVLFLEVAEGAEESPELGGLVELVAAAMAAGELASGDPQATALVLWCAIHGAAALAVANPSVPDDVVRGMSEATIDAVLRGLGD